MSKRSWKKRIGIVLGIFVVVIVCALVILFSRLNVIIKQAVETVGPKITGTVVTLDDAAVSPFSGTGELNGLIVGNPEGFNTDSAFTLGTVSVALVPRSILSDTVHIREIIITDPQITYEFAMGKTNIGAIKAHVEAMMPKAEEEEPEGPGKKVVIDRVVVDGAKVRFSATLLQGQAATLPLPRIELTDIGKDDDGATMVEAVNAVLDAIWKEVQQAAGGSEQIGDALMEGGKAIGDGVKNTSEGVLDGIQGVFGSQDDEQK